MEQLQHTTIDGQRWDQVATEYYGAQTIEVEGVERSAVGFLIEQNPSVPVYDVFPDGVILDIPIISEAQVQTDKEKLPPWKR
ncbi:tail protein X [Terrimonas ginsenosidimutans]|uniref:tail protein X n=1 Tax=Terrimonas ginsenosidimutans TaxID=2908004 RepID=UPI003D79611B